MTAVNHHHLIILLFIILATCLHPQTQNDRQWDGDGEAMGRTIDVGAEDGHGGYDSSSWW